MPDKQPFVPGGATGTTLSARFFDACHARFFGRLPRVFDRLPRGSRAGSQICRPIARSAYGRALVTRLRLSVGCLTNLLGFSLIQFVATCRSLTVSGHRAPRYAAATSRLVTQSESRRPARHSAAGIREILSVGLPGQTFRPKSTKPRRAIISNGRPHLKDKPGHASLLDVVHASHRNRALAGGKPVAVRSPRRCHRRPDCA